MKSCDENANKIELHIYWYLRALYTKVALDGSAMLQMLLLTLLGAFRYYYRGTKSPFLMKNVLQVITDQYEIQNR